jgi:glycosyltransferase involved in cell wall biosynthesis
LAVGEAMAVGLPVIASNIDSLKELVGGCGLLVNPRRIDSITDAIVKLLEDEEMREKFGKCAKARIKRNYSEEKMVKRTIAVYRELLKE